MFAVSRQIDITWGDCDPAGIVYFPRYFEMFDAATTRLVEAALGEKKRDWLGRHGVAGIPLVACNAQFSAPCRFGDVVTIESRVTRIGRSSFDVAHRLIGPAGLAVEVGEKRVWTGHNSDQAGSLKAVPLPDAVVAALRRDG